MSTRHLKFQNILNRSIEICLWILVVFPPLFKASWDISTLSLIHLWTIAILVLLLVKINQNKSVWILPSLDIPFLVFLFFCTLSLSDSINQFNTRHELFNQINYFLLFFVTYNVINNAPQIKKIMAVLFLNATFICMWGLLQYIAGRNVEASLLNTNILSGYLVMILPLALVSFFYLKSNFYKITFGILVGLIFICLWLTRSLGGIISFYCSGVVLFWLFSKYHKNNLFFRRFKSIIGTILIIIFLVGIILIVYKLREPGVLNRLNWWWGAIKIILDHPRQGVGLGNFGNIYLLYKVGRLNSFYVHNHYLQLASEIGIAGLLAFGWLIVNLLKKGSNTLVNLDNTFPGYFVTGVLSSLGGILIYNLIDFNLYIPANAIIFWILAGLLVGLQPKKLLIFKKIFSTSNKKVIFNLIIGILLLATSIAVTRPYLAIQKFMAGVSYLENKELNQAEILLKEAIFFDTLNDQAYAFLSDVYRQKDNLPASIAQMQKAIALNQYYSPYHHNLSWLYQEQNDLDKAIEEMKKAISYHYQKAAYHYSLGLLYELKGDSKEAQLEFQKAESLKGP